MIVIVLGDVPENIENPTARMLINQHNYLQWKLSDRDQNGKKKKHGRKLFWEKLVARLYGNAVDCCCCPFGARKLNADDITAAEGDVEASVRHRRSCCCPFGACVLSSDDVEAAVGENKVLLIQIGDGVPVGSRGSFYGATHP